MWVEWDWDNWIKPQIDRAVSLGLNAIRVIGAPECVLVDTYGNLLKISQDTYNNRWKQLANYCLQKSLYLYPALCEKYAYETYQTSQGGSAPWNFQNETVTAIITSCALALASYSNIIGFDVFQEGSGSSDGLVLSDVMALYSSIRSVAPNIPLTTSNSSGGFASAATFWNDSGSLSYQVQVAAGGSDFVDLHIYLDSISQLDLDGFINRIGKPVVIGEFGVSQDIAQLTQTARFMSMSTLHNRQSILGSFVWALADQSATSSGQFGVWDNTGFNQPSFPNSVGETPLSTINGKRTFLAGALPSFNKADVPAIPCVQSNLLTTAQARPSNATTGWAVGSNTYLFTDQRGLGFSSTAAGTTLVSTSPVTSIPVSSSLYYTASVSLLAGTIARTVSLQVDWYTSLSVYISSSTAVSGTDSITAPLPFSIVVHAPSNASYAVLVIKALSTAAANEAHIVLANPRVYLATF
jgi:hypothetical protein